jgi:hypothetical protein
VKIVALLFSILSYFAFSQQVDTTWNKRSWLVTSGNVVIGGGSIGFLSAIWYQDYPKSRMHSFDDSKEWFQMDKIGHSYTAYQLSQAEFGVWRWTGMRRSRAAWLSAGIAWTYQFSVEILDGYSAQWGFSWSDLGANTLGAGLFLGQELMWKEQRFQLKFGYWPSPYAVLRPNVLGSTVPERLLKDYNAQSYWMCVSPGAFIEGSSFPKWLQLGIGYSVDAKIDGMLNTYIATNGNRYKAQREYAISLDIDWTQLPIKRKWVKNMLRPLNAIKIPLPSVFWRNGVCYFGMF